MMRLGLLAMISAIVSTCVLVAPASARPRPVCGPKAAPTVAATRLLRIYRRKDDQVVCSRDSAREWRLDPPPYKDECDGSSQGCDGRTHLAVAGRWVVQVSQHLGGGSGTYGFVTLRAAGSRKFAELYIFDEWEVKVTAAAVDRQGAVAWIEHDPFENDPVVPDSSVLSAGGCEEESVGEGANIRHRSLDIESGEIRWQDGDEDHTAPTCPRDSSTRGAKVLRD